MTDKSRRLWPAPGSGNSAHFAVVIFMNFFNVQAAFVNLLFKAPMTSAKQTGFTGHANVFCQKRRLKKPFGDFADSQYI